MYRHKSPHLEINKSKLWRHETHGEAFTLQRHCLLDLALLLISNSKARGNELSSCQKTELSRYHKDAKFDLRDHVTRYSRVDVLNAYFYLFDELFFFGSINPRCSLRLKIQEPSTNGYTMNGRTESMGKGRRNIVTLYLRKSEERTRFEAMSQYVGSLLHEMIHVFIFCWACDQGSCAERTHEGGVGHGQVWQDIAYFLEHAANDKELLGLKLSLSRIEMLAQEVCRTGKPPTSGMLARWNISDSALEAQCQGVRNFGGPAAVRAAIKRGR